MKAGMVVFTSFNGVDPVGIMLNVIHHLGINEKGKTVVRCLAPHSDIVVHETFFEAAEKIMRASPQQEKNA
jgi:hypothetical protein